MICDAGPATTNKLLLNDIINEGHLTNKDNNDNQEISITIQYQLKSLFFKTTMILEIPCIS